MLGSAQSSLEAMQRLYAAAQNQLFELQSTREEAAAGRQVIEEVCVYVHNTPCCNMYVAALVLCGCITASLDLLSSHGCNTACCSIYMAALPYQLPHMHASQPVKTCCRYTAMPLILSAAQGSHLSSNAADTCGCCCR
jgi:hypothetical protein